MNPPTMNDVLAHCYTLAQTIPDKAADPGNWIGLVIGIVLALAIVGMCFLGSRRTHRD